MSAVCELAAPYVANSAVEGREVCWPFRGHHASCLRCQARHAAMRRTARQMEILREEKAVAPPDLEWRVMSALGAPGEVEMSWRAPVAVTAAVVSMAAAIVVWRLRPRTSH